MLEIIHSIKLKKVFRKNIVSETANLFPFFPLLASYPIEFKVDLVPRHEQRSLGCYSSWGHKESDMTEQLLLKTRLKCQVNLLQRDQCLEDRISKWSTQQETPKTNTKNQKWFLLPDSRIILEAVTKSSAKAK